MFTRRTLFTLALVAIGSLFMMGYSFLIKKEEISSLPEDITIQEAALKILDPEYMVVDVRTAKELESGHLQGAINIDIKQSDFAEQIDKLPRDKKYIIYCVSGKRSAVATNTMKSMGFTSVEHMKDGINGWNAQKLPLEK
ncbi:MAG: rhodanese-like domain-containing protein [Desulfovibrionaceae bacterium]